jgi:hypothetical protein
VCSLDVKRDRERASAPLNKARDIASEARIEIADIWKVARARSIRTKDGFDWWPGDFRVSLSAIRRTGGYVPKTWMLSVRTDFLKDIPIKNDRFAKWVALWSGVWATTSAWVYPPAEGFESLRCLWKQAATLVCQHRPAYLTSENASWLPQYLARMGIMQPINARMADSGQTTLGGGVPNISRPGLFGRFLGRFRTGNLLDEIACAYFSIESAPNRWVATGEFHRIADRWGRSDYCVCTADNRGLVLEAHLGDGNDGAMIRLSTDQKHPQLGNGLHGALTLPTAGDMKSIVYRCAGLNLMETMWTDIPQFGCWFPVSFRKRPSAYPICIVHSKRSIRGRNS